MKTKLVVACFGLISTALMIVACQPAFSPADDGRTGRAASADTTAPSTSAVTSSSGATTSTTSATVRRAQISATSTTVAPAPTTTTPPPPRPDSPGGDIEHHWYGTGPQVAMLGDSLTVQSRGHLRTLLADSYAFKLGALYGEGMSGGSLSVNLPDPLMPAVVDEYATDPPDVIVLALGTNDVWQPHIGPVSFERAWHAATRRFPDACLVGVTVTETDRALRYDPAEARQVNRVIRRTADVVVDWASEGPSSRYTDTDQIHLTPEGRRHFAELVLEGVEACGSSSLAARG